MLSPGAGLLRVAGALPQLCVKGVETPRADLGLQLLELRGRLAASQPREASGSAGSGALVLSAGSAASGLSHWKCVATCPPPSSCSRGP